MAQVTVKLFASLATYLPPGAQENAASLACEEEVTIAALLERLKVPKERCHLVLVNGIFVPPSQRQAKALADGDTLSVWPPVAGG